MEEYVKTDKTLKGRVNDNIKDRERGEEMEKQQKKKLEWKG